MNDLEMIKQFAELEGVSFHVSTKPCGNDCVMIQVSDAPIRYVEYDPITNLALTMKAIVDYKVNVNHFHQDVCIFDKEGCDSSDYTYFNSGEDLSRAVIGCILKSEGKWK